MNKLSINKVIIFVLKEAKKPVTIKQIYEMILKNDLYEFKTKTPMGVISNEIRRHSKGSKLSEGRQIDFEKSDQGLYILSKMNS